MPIAFTDVPAWVKPSILLAQTKAEADPSVNYFDTFLCFRDMINETSDDIGYEDKFFTNNHTSKLVIIKTDYIYVAGSYTPSPSPILVSYGQ